MLGRFSTALQHAADVLAPPPPLYEDFVYYWKKLMNHYLDVSKTKPVPIELTNIPNHLDHLLQILLKEEENTDGVGPCLEYLLQHNLLDLLATLASTDDPPGMKQHVLQFVTKLLNQSKSIVIGHLSIYFALQRLVGLCDGSTPTAAESYEIQYLLSVSGILRRNHQLVSVFLSNSNSEGSSSCGRRTSCSSTGSEASIPPRNALFTTPLVPSARASGVTLVPQPVPEPPPEAATQTDVLPQFPLADAVLSYIDSPDTGVRLKACQAMMLLISLPPDVRTAPLIASEASLRLISRLVLLYYTIPHTTEPSHVDDMHLSWGLDIPSNECLSCNGCKQAAIFLSWFDYCNQVMVEGNTLISEAVARRFSESFLGQVFTVATLQTPITLTILTKCFKMATAVYLNNALYDWLINDSVLKTLLGNWLSSNADLAIETLRFFELVLEKGPEYILEPLVLKFIQDRSYLNMGSERSEDNENGPKKEHVMPNISEIIKRWTSVLPKEVQSCTCGYEEYLGESMRQYQAVLSKIAPLPPLAEIPPSTMHFEEGPFFSALMDSLAKIPSQPYELNLELTGIVSRLALRPEHPITEYLLCMTDVSKGRSLYTVLTAVAVELASSISQVPKYRETLVEVRAALLGRSTSSAELRNAPLVSIFESAVVVEELCKELAAISHVKLKTNNT